MECPEQLRLEQLYEAALRRWAHFSVLTRGEGTYLAEEIQRRVLEERDEAKERLRVHRKHCPICLRKLRSAS